MLTQKMRKTKSALRRRSPCPVSCALEIVGDKWTLLIIRDLLLGMNRFKEFSASPEQIPTNLLSERLNRLLDNGIIELCPAPDGTRHQAYRLTDKGKDLSATLTSLKDWGLRWERGTRVLREKRN